MAHRSFYLLLSFFFYFSLPVAADKTYSISPLNNNLCKKIREHLKETQSTIKSQKTISEPSSPIKSMKWYLIRIDFTLSPQVFISIPVLLKFTIAPSLGFQFIRRIPLGDELY